MEQRSSEITQWPARCRSPSKRRMARGRRAPGMPEHVQNTPVAVIGAGSWGTALANLLAAKGYDIRLWARAECLAQRMSRDRENGVYLPGVPLHPGVTPTAHFAEAAQATTSFVSVVPSH